METTPLKNNTEKHQFESQTDGKLSFVVYEQVDDNTLALTHTEVDPSLEGQGVGSKLVEDVLNYIDQHNMRIVSQCPFVSTYIKRHPDWNRVVSEKYNPDEV